MEFPWREAVSCIEEIGTKESFACSLDLCRHGVLAGPSSGLALRGLLKFLQKTKDNGQEALDSLRGPDGRIDCVFICCDLPFQYIAEYIHHLGEDYFPPIFNAELVGVDSYPYRPEWEITAKDIAAQIAKETGDDRTLVIDIRKLEDYNNMRIPFPNSANIDIEHCGQPNPFRDASTLVKQWTRLDKKIGPKVESLKVIHPWLDDKDRVQVVCMCYDGHTAKIATRSVIHSFIYFDLTIIFTELYSLLRARGVVANYVVGGYEQWVLEALPIVRTVHSITLMERVRRLLAF